MKYQAIVRSAAGVVAAALLAGGAIADAPRQPEPLVMSDVQPLPASERGSIGAVVVEPVLAKKEYLLSLGKDEQAVDTRTMGAGPLRMLRRIFTQEELDHQRAIEEAEREKGGSAK